MRAACCAPCRAARRKTREVVQIGAELFGEPGIAGDREVHAAAPVVARARPALAGLHLDLGHVGVYRALAAGAGIAGNGEDTELFAALRAKDVPGGRRAHAPSCPAAWRDALARAAGAVRPGAARCSPRRARRCPTRPRSATRSTRSRRSPQSAEPHVEALHIDLADLRGYHYQNGAIFSVFTAGEPSAIGNGGRYDGIGKAFGRARPATGFTLDLRQLADVVLREAA